MLPSLLTSTPCLTLPAAMPAVLAMSAELLAGAAVVVAAAVGAGGVLRRPWGFRVGHPGRQEAEPGQGHLPLGGVATLDRLRGRHHGRG